jgi:hypothetical protein
MKEVDLVYRTMFAELLQRCLDASFHSDFPVEGRFVTVPVKGRKYWYFDIRKGEKVERRYVGPHDDPELAQRVAAFNEVKDDVRGRRKLVSTLTREAGLAPPERFTGDVVAALAAAGLFRLRAVLVGTVAFQCYPGLLGIKLPTTAMQTSDADFAQFHAVSTAVEDSLPPVLDILRSVDPSFRAVPDLGDPHAVTQFVNRARFTVEFLTPNGGSDDHQGAPVPMPALGGASAQPMRFLDFLIRDPVRSAMLHRSGIAVSVPAPERYAIHKLIVASRRHRDASNAAKREKDIRQAALLFEALDQSRRQADLALAFKEAWHRGSAWRDAIKIGLSYMPSTARQCFETGIIAGLRELSEDPSSYRLSTNTT